MTDIAGSTIPENTTTVRLGVADWLCLAATPTFAAMALFALLQRDDGVMSCLGASPLTSMPAMYLLMSAFHLAPWLRVISGRQIRQ